MRSGFPKRLGFQDLDEEKLSPAFNAQKAEMTNKSLICFHYKQSHNTTVVEIIGTITQVFLLLRFHFIHTETEKNNLGIIQDFH